MKYTITDTSLIAIADAIRGKTGGTEQLSPEAMAAAITAIETGGGLPNGVATGTFNTTAETIKGDFQIEHGLGAIPNVVLIYREEASLSSNIVQAVIRVNIGEEQDGETGEYYPSVSSERAFYTNSAGSNIAQVAGGISYSDDRTYFCVPSVGKNGLYPPVFVYRWFAVASGV